MTRLFLPVVALLLICHAHAHARAQNVEDLNRLIARTRIVTDISLSPDGKSVAALITDTTEAGGRAHVWLLARDRAPQQITGLGSDSTADDASPSWSLDGRSILFLHKSAGAASVMRFDLGSGRSDSLGLSRTDGIVAGSWGAGAVAKPLIAKGFSIGPAGKLAVWAADPPSEAMSAAAARKDDQHLFGQSDPIHLYLLDGRGSVREIALPDGVRQGTWRQDGRQFVVITAPATDDLGDPDRVWLIDEEAAPREIRGTAENVQAVSWLPDGRIAYFARCSRNAPIVCLDLFTQALDGSAPRNLTDGIDGSLINGSDGTAHPGPIVTADGHVLVTIARRFEQQIAQIRPSDGQIRWVDALPAIVRAVSVSADRRAYALLAADRGGAFSVKLADAQLRKPVPAVLPELQPADWKPLRGRRLTWQSDHHEIDGLLYVPDGTSANTRVPLVVDVHGGPAGRFEDSDLPLLRLLLAEGWAVLHVNPRGSFGYGVDFLASLQDDLGGADYRDIMAGVDAAVAAGPIDAQKMALIGYSYGATIASFTLGRTQRFKALVAVAPVVDQISEYGTEGSSWYDRWYFGQPWKRLDAAWRQSPLSVVATARTPLLLLHGESDPVNPPSQSLELFRALRQQGSPVELMLFPRETHREIGHNFYGLPSVEPRHGIALRQRLLDFLRSALGAAP